MKYLNVWVDDINQRIDLSLRLLEVYAFHELNAELILLSRKLEEFNFPLPAQYEFDELHKLIASLSSVDTLFLSDATDFNLSSLQEFVEQCCSNHEGGLFPSQRVVFDRLVNKLNCNEQLLAFIDARGGTGKTYLLNALLAFARCSSGSRITPALAVATSGISSTQLINGRTFHSRFRAPLNVLEHSVLDISVQTQLADLIRQCVLIVRDEAPMAHRFLLEALDRILRDITNCDAPFGGKSIVLAGDFR